MSKPDDLFAAFVGSADSMSQVRLGLELSLELLGSKETISGVVAQEYAYRPAVMRFSRAGDEHPYLVIEVRRGSDGGVRITHDPLRLVPTESAVRDMSSIAWEWIPEMLRNVPPRYSVLLGPGEEMPVGFSERALVPEIALDRLCQMRSLQEELLDAVIDEEDLLSIDRVRARINELCDWFRVLEITPQEHLAILGQRHEGRYRFITAREAIESYARSKECLSLERGVVSGLSPSMVEWCMPILELALCEGDAQKAQDNFLRAVSRHRGVHPLLAEAFQRQLVALFERVRADVDVGAPGYPKER